MQLAVKKRGVFDMADLLSHALIAHTVKRLSPFGKGAYLFFVGTLLPDVLGRAPRILLHMFTPKDWTVSPVVMELWNVAHTPIPFVVLMAAVAFLWPEKKRLKVFANLSLGGLVHIAVDVTQWHIEGNVYRLLWPISEKGYELGWVGTEASLSWIPYLIPLALGGEWVHRRRLKALPAPNA